MKIYKPKKLSLVDRIRFKLLNISMYLSFNQQFLKYLMYFGIVFANVVIGYLTYLFLKLGITSHWIYYFFFVSFGLIWYKLLKITKTVYILRKQNNLEMLNDVNVDKVVTGYMNVMTGMKKNE